jgi:tRNA threonylcarbamoyladenosine biosynthesis protein TsaB
MRLLAIDTAMAACSAAVLEEGADLPRAAAFVAMERGHAEALAPMVAEAMAKARLGFRDLDRIAVTIGPGTFTGVRIGLALARGLGLALAVPVIGIDTLTAIAANEPADGLPLLVAADARREEVYGALYDGAGRNLVPARLLAVAEAAAGLPAGPVRISGSAAEAIIATSTRGDLIRATGGDLPVAARFGRLALAMPAPDHMPEPLYLRAPDAKPQGIPPARHG